YTLRPDHELRAVSVPRHRGRADLWVSRHDRYSYNITGFCLREWSGQYPVLVFQRAVRAAERKPFRQVAGQSLGDLRETRLRRKISAVRVETKDGGAHGIDVRQHAFSDRLTTIILGHRHRQRSDGTDGHQGHEDFVPSHSGAVPHSRLRRYAGPLPRNAATGRSDWKTMSPLSPRAVNSN